LGRIERDAASELTQARALEHAGQVEEAIARIDHALRSTQDQDSAWIRRSRPDWQNERQRLVRQHLESLLASLDQRAPDDALGVTEEIARWCAGETELQDLANRASVAAQRTRVRRAGEELGKAKDELDRNIFVRVVARLQRVLDDLGTDNDEQANKIRAEVDELVAQASSKRGIVIEPPTGEFLPGLGDSQWYAKSLHEPLRFAASQGGFLPTPDDGRLRTSWDRNARYRVRVHVSEEFGPYFEQSVNPTSRIDVTVQLVREGASQWQHRISARTRIPPVGLTGYEAGYMGIGDKPNPEAVKRLYDDARASLLELLPGRLRTFPRAVEELG
jgi:tetratricopeptide (TPR) repeat protein